MWQRHNDKVEFVRERDRLFQENSLRNFFYKNKKSTSHVENIKSRLLIESEVNKELRLQKENLVSQRLRL